jgi:DNA-directed RNA polymerase specialized sigma subunit
MTPEQEKLILENQIISKSIARKYARGIFTGMLDDFQGEAALALVEAAIKFDSSKKVKFTSYANKIVSWRLQDYLRKLDVMSRSERKEFKHTGVVSNKVLVQKTKKTKPCKAGIKLDTKLASRFHKHTNGDRWNKSTFYCLDINAIKRGLMMAGCF